MTLAQRRAATAPLAPPPTRRRTWRLLGVGVLILAVAAAGVWSWSAPREHVEVPGPEATPEQVVRAYAAALNARDFDTVEAIDATGNGSFSRFSLSRPRLDDLEIRSITGSRSRAHVVFSADFSGWDASMADGRDLWGYVLERDHDGRWRIVDAGVA